MFLSNLYQKFFKMQKDQPQHSQKYNGFLTGKNNYVWGGAMCLAWNELKNSIIKAPIKLKTSNKHALKMIQNFNAERFVQKDIDPSSVYTKSGLGKKTMDQINTQVKQKFPEKTTPPLDLPVRDDSIIAYAYLFKKLSFVSKFERLPNKNFLFNNEHNVDAFYAEQKEQRKQIEYCQYEDRDNFVIAIKSQNPKDLLFLVKNPKELKVQEVFEKCIQKQLKPIGNTDEFMMPVVELDLSHSIDELKLAVLNQGFTDYFIQQIYENLKLKIDESGAKVESEAVIMMNRCAPMPVQIKEFVLDKPFWIVMKETGRHPYLAIYIRNPIQTK